MNNRTETILSHFDDSDGYPQTRIVIDGDEPIPTV